jgi:hypothetical protein
MQFCGKLLVATSPTEAGYESVPTAEATSRARGETTLPIHESVYDQALVAPLLRGKRFLAYFSSLLVLAVNLGLQGLVLYKVHDLTQAHEREIKGKTFSLCKHRSAGSMPFHRNLGEEVNRETAPADGVYIGCAPLDSTMLASTVSVLDVNDDDYWTRDEAATLKRKWEEHYDKESNLPEMFDIYINRARLGRMNHQGGGAAAKWAKETAQYTRLPMKWMAAEQQDLTICVGLNPELCGNFDARGILEKHGIGRHYLEGVVVAGNLTRNERIAACDDVLRSKCPDLYGQGFKVYVKWQQELCGSASSNWDDARRIITTQYSLAATYAEDDDAIVTWSYRIFLFVILTLWWMLMVEELRILWRWWIVLPAFPSEPQASGPAIEVKDDRAVVLAMPMAHKAGMVLVNLLPRTVICVWLSYVGSWFLIEADNYTDLILNSVALGFLIEIDNMLYSAVTEEEVKDMMQRCDPLAVPAASTGDSHSSIPLTVFLLGLGSGFVMYAYVYPFGKNQVGLSLSCLCHGEGVRCITAQILGGAAFLKWAG